MSIAIGGGRGAGSSKDAGTDSVSPSLSAAVAVGKDLVVVGVRVPPNEDVIRDPDNIFVLSYLDCVNPPSFSDDKGNTYSALLNYYYTRGNGDQHGGVPESGDVIASIHVAKARITTALTTSDHFKVDWNANGGARAVGSLEVQVGAGKQLAASKVVIGQFEAKLAPTDMTPNLDIAGISGESLLLALLGIAGPQGDTYSPETGLWTAVSAPGTTGGADESNATLRWSRKVASVTSDSFDPTLGTGREGIAGLVALKEV